MQEQHVTCEYCEDAVAEVRYVMGAYREVGDLVGVVEAASEWAQARTNAEIIGPTMDDRGACALGRLFHAERTLARAIAVLAAMDGVK